MSLGKRLKQLRLAQGKTQNDVAESIGIAKSTYSLYESDKREPNVLSLKKLAKTLNTTGDYLLELHELADDDGEPLRLLVTMERLNPEGRERVLRYANDLLASGNYENQFSNSLPNSDSDKNADIEANKISEDFANMRALSED